MNHPPMGSPEVMGEPCTHAPVHRSAASSRRRIPFLPLGIALCMVVAAKAQAPQNPATSLAEDAVSAAPLLHYRTSAIGNTFGDGVKWVQKDGQSLAVTPGGRCYVGGTWDESGKGVGIYKAGDTAGQLQGISVTTGLMAVDDRYVYAGIARSAKDASGKDINHYGVGRWLLNGDPAPWPGGENTGRGPMNFLPIGFKWLAGACTLNGELFVADPGSDSIRIFDPDTFFISMTVAGDRVFAIQRYKSIIHVYDTHNGKEVGLMTPGPEAGGSSGWCDMEEGIQAYRRKHGEILIFAEDDYRERIILYQIPQS